LVRSRQNTKLQRAIQEVNARVKAQPKRPAQPPYEKRVPKER
jgi:hypothetical protein